MSTNAPRGPARRAVIHLLLGILGTACAPSERPVDSPDNVQVRADEMDAGAADSGNGSDDHNTLTDEERAAGWQLLFDGESLEGWRQYGTPAAPEGWRAEDGMLHRFASGGDIMTVDMFADFELELEWRISEGGNSGIFYLGRTGFDYIHDVAPEMQVLDDATHPDGQSPLTSAGSVFGLYPAPRGVVRPAGRWNEVRVVVDGGRIEHWMNAEKIIEYELGSPDWQQRVADSKFAGTPYGTFRSGHIGLQDHGDPVWFRNIKLRPVRDTRPPGGDTTPPVRPLDEAGP